MNDGAEAVIEVENLRKSFGGLNAVKGLSMKVTRGEIFGFLGPNGSGKTTTIRMMCGLLVPDKGRGRCLGFDVMKEAIRIKERVGYMTQAFSLYDDLTIEENLDFLARMYGISGRKMAVREGLEKHGLVERRNQLVGTLSGGWKQRLALAACLIHKPQLLLLDEPTAGVDPKARFEFWDKIHELAAEGVTVLVSTHYMDDVGHCTKLAYIVAGEVLAQGSPEEIVEGSGLTTWSVKGPDVWTLSKKLAALPGVANVSTFGASLHVSGYDSGRLNESLMPFMNGPHRFEPVRPALEDVFISLMKLRGNGA